MVFVQGYKYMLVQPSKNHSFPRDPGKKMYEYKRQLLAKVGKTVYH